MKIRIGLVTKKMEYFRVCMHLQMIQSQEELNKYNNQFNLHKLNNKMQIKKHQHLIKKVKIRVG
jgi:hypothetical protein